MPPPTAAAAPPLRVCVRCVMDTSDPEITFDERGVCRHCRDYDRMVARRVPTGAEAKARLDDVVARIQRDGVGKDYDCIAGVSGGVDSTYVCWKAKQLGLRPLAVHLDNGWDSELAVANIQRTLEKLGIELYTHVIDWNEFRDLQLAFLRASTPDSEIPSDHAIFSLMGQTARQHGVRYVLTGMNHRTESHLPRAWSQGHMDWKYIRSVHRRFGKVPLTTFPYRTLWQLIRDRWSLTWVNLLNLTEYSKTRAMAELERELGWEYYGGKHYESIYTRFYQGYLLPRKFGYDKRKTHLSSLICAGEMTRDDALAELQGPPYPPDLQAQDREYVAKKLGLSDAEFEEILHAPPRRFEEFPSSTRGLLFRTLRRIYHRFAKS
jgi:N-acetyl sugar amidotransferase